MHLSAEEALDLVEKRATTEQIHFWDTHMGTERGKEMLMRTPMGRFGSPEELVGVAILLASDGAKFITGQAIAVDGGYLASGVNQ